MDTLVTPGPDNTIFTTIYRKPIHTDQHLQWDICHNLYAKFSVFVTLTHSARTVCTNPKLLQKEEEHIKRALQRCKFLSWALNGLKLESNHRYNTTQTNNTLHFCKNTVKAYIYNQGGTVFLFHSRLACCLLILANKNGIVISELGSNFSKNRIIFSLSTSFRQLI